jgi:hypothetical protein
MSVNPLLFFMIMSFFMFFPLVVVLTCMVVKILIYG